MGIQGWGGLSGVGPHPLQLLPVPPASLMATLNPSSWLSCSTFVLFCSLHSNPRFNPSTEASTHTTNMPFSAAPYSQPCNQEK